MCSDFVQFHYNSSENIKLEVFQTNNSYIDNELQSKCIFGLVIVRTEGNLQQGNLSLYKFKTASSRFFCLKRI